VENVLCISALVKRYGRITAVNNLSLQVPEASVFGILGPNGSGKTTTLSIILGIVNADSGNFDWFGGLGASESRLNIGSLLEKPNFYPYLSAEQNLKITADIKNIAYSNIFEVLETVR